MIPCAAQPRRTSRLAGIHVTLVPAAHWTSCLEGPKQWLPQATGVIIAGGIVLIVVAMRTFPAMIIGLPCAAACLLAPALWTWKRRSAARRWWRGSIGGERSGDPNLVCIGDPLELMQFLDVPNVETEPVIIRRVSVDPYHLGHNVHGGLAFAIIAIGLLPLFLLPNWEVWMTLAILAMWCIALRMGALLRPIYYRVVPGRLDIMQFGLLRTKPTSCESVPLRRARISCDLKKCVLKILPNANSAPERVIPLRELDCPLDLILAAFRAAALDREAAPLPRDELLG